MIEAVESYRPVVQLMRARLDRDFTLVARGGQRGFTPEFDIYERTEEGLDGGTVKVVGSAASRVGCAPALAKVDIRPGMFNY